MGGKPEDHAVVICAPYSREVLRQVPGNVLRRCDECRCRIVASPQALRQAREGGRLICFRCGRASHPGPGIGPVPGGLDAAAEHLGLPRAALDQVGREMRAIPLLEMDMFPDTEHDPPERKP